jgi:hypothetical protein
LRERRGLNSALVLCHPERSPAPQGVQGEAEDLKSSFAELVLSKILQSLRYFRITRSEGLRI